MEFLNKAKGTQQEYFHPLTQEIADYCRKKGEEQQQSEMRNGIFLAVIALVAAIASLIFTRKIVTFGVFILIFGAIVYFTRKTTLEFDRTLRNVLNSQDTEYAVAVLQKKVIKEGVDEKFAIKNRYVAVMITLKLGDREETFEGDIRKSYEGCRILLVKKKMTSHISSRQCFKFVINEDEITIQEV